MRLSHECQNQTNSKTPETSVTMLSCSPYLSPGEGMAAAREEVTCQSTGWQPAGSSPPVPSSTSPGCSGTGRPVSLPSYLLILPSPYKIPRQLDVAHGESKHHRMGNWSQPFQRKISCQTPNSEQENFFQSLQQSLSPIGEIR